MKQNYKLLKSRKEISIRWKLIAYMSAFVALLLMVTWLFQVFLLDIFFLSVKKKEMKGAALQLAATLETDQLPAQVYEEAADHSLCVIIYQINQQKISKKTSVDATGSNVIMSLTQERLWDFYEKAMENGGSRFARISFGGYEIQSDTDMDVLFDQMEAQDEFGEPVRIPTKNVRLVYIHLAKTASNQQYVILLDTNMQPLNSTVQTLTVQYLWIAVIILIMTSMMVVILYRRISSPIIRMNQAAKLLAKGRYDVEFSGEGYRETRELADTLNYASNELSRLDGLQKELIANISHDLRTPLTMIRGYGEMMRDLPGENTPENMQVIIDETTRLSALVTDLLDLSKLQSGTATATPTLFNLTNAVREVLLRYDQLIKHNGYRVSFAYDVEVNVYADRGMLLQVLYNLINNAINYTGEDRTVTVTQTVLEQSVRITVTDTGDGIAPEEMPLIWDRYYKVDKVHRRAMIGTGLGLSIVKEILEKHQAAYGVNSKLGEGSSFWFELPVIEAQIKNQVEE